MRTETAPLLPLDTIGRLVDIWASDVTAPISGEQRTQIVDALDEAICWAVNQHFYSRPYTLRELDERIKSCHIALGKIVDILQDASSCWGIVRALDARAGRLSDEHILERLHQDWRDHLSFAAVVGEKFQRIIADYHRLKDGASSQQATPTEWLVKAVAVIASHFQLPKRTRKADPFLRFARELFRELAKLPKTPFKELKDDTIRRLF